MSRKFLIGVVSGYCYESLENGQKLSAEVFEPEFVVGILEMIALIAVIAVHAVRIDHEVELLAGTMEDIQKLEGILMMDVVVSGAVGQFQHDWLNRLPRR